MSAMESSSGLRGAIPQVFTSFGGLLPGAWGTPNKGNPDGAEGIFGLAGRVWASALQRIYLKNGLVPHSYVGGTYDE